MIHVDRDRSDENGRPVRPDDAWFLKAHEAKERALRDGAVHVVEENVYRAQPVRIALEELFHRKCAYCETPLSEVDWQVEHFRPKGGVTERPDHPGYYWLAYEWTNLYPACIPCNQRRKDRPTWQDPGVGETLGKANRFPVEDEAHRALEPNEDLKRERPLLLDPCLDQPERSFLYNPLGDVEPAPGDVRAEVSIEVFHLRRRRLRDRRGERISAVTTLLKLVRQLEEDGATARAKALLKDLEESFFADSAPFAGAARHVRRDPDAFGI